MNFLQKKIEIGFRSFFKTFSKIQCVRVFFFFSVSLHFSSSLFHFFEQTSFTIIHVNFRCCFSSTSVFLRSTATQSLETLQGYSCLCEVREEVQRLEKFADAHEFLLPNGTALYLPLLPAKSQNSDVVKVPYRTRTHGIRHGSGCQLTSGTF